VSAVRYRLILAGSAFVAHLPLLFNDGTYWDGWIFSTATRRGEWDVIQRHVSEAGFPPTYLLFYKLIGLAQEPILVFRIASVVLIAALGLLVFEILVRTTLASAREAFLAALLAIVYPVYQVQVTDVMVPNLMWTVCLVGGVLCAVVAERRDGLAHFSLRGLALALIVVGLGYPPNIGLVAGLLALVPFATRPLDAAHLKEVVARWLPRRLDYVIVPAAYLVIFLLVPRAGGYVGEYRLSGTTLAQGYGAFVVVALFQLARSIAEAATHLPVIAPAVALTAALLWASRRQMSGAVRSWRSFERYGLFAAGLGILVAAVFPYAAIAGKLPRLDGWEVRHLAALSVGLPLLLVGAARLVPRATDRGVVATVTAVLVVIAAGFVQTGNDAYAGWQARWAVDRALLAQVDRDAVLRYPVLLVIDETGIGVPEPYRFYEVAGMIRSLTEQERNVGFDSRLFVQLSAVAIDSMVQQNARLFVAHYEAADVDPLGCRALLRLQSRWRDGDAALALRYTEVRLFRPREMDDFLHSILTVTLVAVDTPGATHCPAP
jgi:hypothetical protein